MSDYDEAVKKVLYTLQATTRHLAPLLLNKNNEKTLRDLSIQAVGVVETAEVVLLPPQSTVTLMPPKS